MFSVVTCGIKRKTNVFQRIFSQMFCVQAYSIPPIKQFSFTTTPMIVTKISKKIVAIRSFVQEA